MKEIYNNGKLMLSSEDGVSIPIIWNNLVGKNSETRSEHASYLRFARSQGFENGTIELKHDGVNISEHDIKLPF